MSPPSAQSVRRPCSFRAGNAMHSLCRLRASFFKSLLNPIRTAANHFGSQNDKRMAKTRHNVIGLHLERPTSSAISVILDILKEVSPLVPIPGLRTVLDVASAILARIQNVQSLGKQFGLLAQCTGALVLAITGELSETANPPISTVENVNLLLLTLQRIQEFVSTESARNWMSRFLHDSEITDKLKEHMEQLNTCCKAFQIKSLIRIRSLLESVQAGQGSAINLLHEIKDLLQTESVMTQTYRSSVSIGLANLSTAVSSFQNTSQQDREITLHRHEEVVQAIHNLRLKGDDGECRVYRQGDIIITRILHRQDSMHGPVCLATLREDGRPVLLKRYGSGGLARQRFARELPKWRAICHPNIPQLLGHSLPSSENPFVVVTGVTTTDVAQYVRARAADPDPKVGFMTGLSMLQGVSSALEYLRSNCKLGKYELQDCAKVSNFLLDNEGRVVLGHNILHCVPGPDEHDSLKLEQWVIDQFWIITETMLFDSPYKFTDWEVVSGNCGAAHMRALLRLAAWYPDQRFTAVQQRIDDLSSLLLDQMESYGSLTWNRIREEFLRTEGIQHHMFYRPQERWDVQLFDIGFVRNGRFVRLCNVADQVDYALDHEKPICFAAFPDIPPVVSILPDGMTRYAFDRPLFSAIQKTASGARVKASAEPFRFMMKQSPMILAEHARRHPELEIKDLIFIVGTNELPQSAAFEWHAAHEQDPGPQRTVFFYEYPDLLAGQPWGFWSFEPTPIAIPDKLHPQVTVSADSPPQTIVFVQLENHDCPRITEI